MGLAAGLFLVLSGLTGSMIVFREEIETLIHPEWMRADVASNNSNVVSLQTVLDTVKRAYPQDKLLSVRMPRGPQQTYLLKMNDAHGLFNIWILIVASCWAGTGRMKRLWDGSRSFIRSS